VPGLGPAKKRILLAHFGSVDEVLKAREDDLAKIAGIGPKLAKAIAGRLERPASATDSREE
jgi:excinuclease ABC subunit C